MFECEANLTDLAQPGEPNLTRCGEPIWLAHFIKEKLLCAEIKTAKQGNQNHSGCSFEKTSAKS